MKTPTTEKAAAAAEPDGETNARIAKNNAVILPIVRQKSHLHDHGISVRFRCST